MKVSELYYAVAMWAAGQGAKDLANTPGLWKGRTLEQNGLGPFDVKINGHDETIESVPPFNIYIGNEEWVPGVVAILAPNGGAMFHSPRRNENENGLIAYFRAQTPEQKGHGND